jgi:dienelactone hydrolase
MRRIRAIAALWLLLGAPTSAVSGPLELPFTLTTPPGRGPFPAVVLLHDCSGLGPRSSGSPWRWSARLAAGGYVTIWPDSFSTRGYAGGVCTERTSPDIFERRAADAYAALAHLRTLAQVDQRRIAVMGGSHGGSSALAAIVDVAENRRHAGRFAAAVALYPGCGRSVGDWSVTRDRYARHRITGYSGVFKPMAPLLILTGELDDWTPAEPCRRLAAASRQAGHPVEFVAYPDAHHAFDSAAPLRYVAERLNINAPSGHGATTGGNEVAWDDATTRVKAFLAKHLPAASAR